MDADAFECNGPEAKTLCTALFQAVDQGASDLHVVAGHRPTVRLNGRLQELPGNVLNEACVRAGLLDLCPECSREQFARDRNVDFALDINLKGRSQRFRANYFLSGHTPGACFRIIPSAIPDLGWANFPADLAVRLTNFRNGLVLITGISGAGKTTTLAMLINLLLSEGNYRIITVEEPIEYNFPSRGNSIVTQREVGRDVATFADGLKYGLRQDPDVILVGEIRDRDTAQMALSAAETGHLVLCHAPHARRERGHFPFCGFVSATGAGRNPCPARDGPAGRRVPALIAEHDRDQTRVGARDPVQQFAHRQRDPHGQGRKHRPQHPHQPGGGDDPARRVGAAAVSGRQNQPGNGRAVRLRQERRSRDRPSGCPYFDFALFRLLRYFDF